MTDQILPNIRVPVSLVADPQGFGGQRYQDCLQGDLRIIDGRAAGLVPPSDPSAPIRMVLPKLTEPHVHLDKCHTISRMAGVGGDLRAAIEAQAQDRRTWTPADIRTRASRGLRELITAGCGTVRSHVDWGQDADDAAPSTAWSVLLELAQEYRGRIALQVAPLIGVDMLADQAVARNIGYEIAAKGGVLGAFVLGQPNRRAGIRNAFDTAQERGLMLDFHVDEGLDPNLDGLRIIAETALETGFQGPVLCGHACSLVTYASDDLARLADQLARSNITLVTLPAANLYLQGRRDGTPNQRGLTCVRELRRAGVNVLIGTDNVRDAFCPLGRFDPRQSLALASLAAHLDPPFGPYLPMITTNAETALGLAARTVDGAAADDLIVFDVNTTADLLGDSSPPTPLSTLVKGDMP